MTTGFWNSNFRRYESTRLLRGLRLSLNDVKRLYSEIQQVVDRQKGTELAVVTKPENVDQAAHDARVQELRERAFSLTVTIRGADGENVLGSSDSVFDDTNLPDFIQFIYFTNKTAYQHYANGAEPTNRFDVYLDFAKPALSDPNPLVSAPTPNNSNVTISGGDFEFVRAIDAIVLSRLNSHRSIFSFIHKSFAYDVILWFIAIPYILYFFTIGRSILDLFRRKHRVDPISIPYILFLFIIDRL